MDFRRGFCAFKIGLSVFVLWCVFGCSDEVKKPYDDGKDIRFTNIPASHSNIHFENKVEETSEFNFLNYSYIYNGGGVGVGDFNNDGLEDIYFTSNQKSNKLYLNRGNFVFEDITDSAGVEDKEGWSTGVTIVDINNDGWLDIYVCKSASIQNRKARQNKLFVNQKNNTFKEQAIAYGLKENGFSTQAYFFDYDKDGDLDMYLLNHSLESKLQTLLDPQLQTRFTKDDLDRLFRNDNGKYVDVSKEAGIQKKAWGLSASVGDFNNDGWPDIYVANDFLEPDFLFINNQDGTFTDEILARFKHISNNSMGSDFADINNDLLPDLVVLDMLAADRKRGKENMATMSTSKFNRMVNRGWHYQYMSNMLQLNNGDGTFSEIGQFAHISKTDWSWAALLADFDNDGFNDLFVSNGIEKDIANQDFRHEMRKNLSRHDEKKNLELAMQLIPSSKLSNYMFLNNRDYTFKDVSKNFGIDANINSNGVAYADFDNDGDLDLVLNNQLDKAYVYRNNSKANYLKLSFVGPKQNKKAIGTRGFLFAESLQQTKTVNPARGYQSSVTYDLNFGLGENNKADSLKVVWPDGKVELIKDIRANQHLQISYNNPQETNVPMSQKSPGFEEIPSSDFGIKYKHEKVKFNDFNMQVLLPQKQSTIDNALAVADVNNDGLDDIFVGNTSGFPAQLYLQESSGIFSLTNQPVFQKDKIYNDNNAKFFDCDNDGDLDLYVASGNYSLTENNKLLQDRLYLNNGHGIFSRGRLPRLLNVTKAIATVDFDKDGDLDVFVGGRVVPAKYPQAPDSFLLENKNGTFINVTDKKAKGLKHIGMVNDAMFSDYDMDGDADLIVVGEWMSLTLFENENGLYSKKELRSDNKTGWFQCIKAIDFDADGDDDYFVGNIGENNKFHPTEDSPLHIYANYFDDNNSYDFALTKAYNGNLFPIRGKECSTEQTPFLKDKIATYKGFANSSISEIYGQDAIDGALHLSASTFSSYFIMNKGKAGLEFQRLPNVSQFGPVLDFEFLDANGDGILEVLGIGTLYDAEVETIRYDGSKGFILKASEEQGSFEVLHSSISNAEVKQTSKITIGGKQYLVLLVAGEELRFLRINQ
ncbi:VCBS repeat-containing protein [Hyunsoonleella sp. SJ7]|uniref:VCBS repeat-containing protein n=1 Tax=Hyunsoonleella aquatilis TaxID=2762758 RepID=A0A923KKC7_9FLAO|nr:VCBS repeat-containing protein [Hyunsoonleella aquatilis]MBC3758362.1 VCBS repeat-containing protein [Hyunsoonleella aquatilis]